VLLFIPLIVIGLYDRFQLQHSIRRNFPLFCGMSAYHLKHGGDPIGQAGTGYFGCRDHAEHFSAETSTEKAALDSRSINRLFIALK
jgi:hypothetical protein